MHSVHILIFFPDNNVQKYNIKLPDAIIAATALYLDLHEFIGIWEGMYNPSFNSPEFEGIKNEAGLNRFVLSVKQWTEKTNSIGIVAKAGRYGGTYAHKDIAFEFAAWVSPQFKLYLLKEFQRLKNKSRSCWAGAPKGNYRK